jgi:hypothetical protein
VLSARLPLGTPYPVVARRIAEIVNRVREQTGTRHAVYVYFDATGVGQPIVDLVAEHRIKAWILPVYFTHGDRRTQDTEKVTLGKASSSQGSKRCSRAVEFTSPTAARPGRSPRSWRTTRSGSARTRTTSTARSGPAPMMTW